MGYTNGLEKGSQLTLMRQDDNSLLILPEGLIRPEKPSHAVIEVKPTEDPNSIIRKLVSTYLVGYNEIFIKTKNLRITSTLRNTIKNFTRKKLVGTEIIADSPNELNMKVLLSYPELSIQSALRRMVLITSSMHKDAIMALKKLDKELARDVIAMDDEVDRFNLYIIRQIKAAVQKERIIKEIGLSTGRDVLGYRLITKSVERTADHAVKIAENVLNLKNPLEPEIVDQVESMSGSSISIFNEAIESLFRLNFQLANNIVQKAKQVVFLEKELVKSILKRTDVEEVSSLRLIIESIRRAAEYASDIAEIIMNLSVNQIINRENDISSKT